VSFFCKTFPIEEVKPNKKVLKKRKKQCARAHTREWRSFVLLSLLTPAPRYAIFFAPSWILLAVIFLPQRRGRSKLFVFSFALAAC
jgi:hypothetical protein